MVFFRKKNKKKETTKKSKKKTEEKAKEITLEEPKFKKEKVLTAEGWKRKKSSIK